MIEIGKEIKDVNSRIFYLVSKFDKCYLLSDIKDMSKEYIFKVKELMDNFKTDIVANNQNKMLHYRIEFFELKGD